MIYRDVLGHPEAGGIVSRISPSDMQSPYVMHTISDAARREWPGDTDLTTIAWDLGACGWDTHVDDLRGIIIATHRDTAAEIRQRQMDGDARYAGGEDGYVRYGSLPAGGRSRNHRDQVAELGVSVFRAQFGADGIWRVLIRSEAEHATWLHVRDRTPYRVYGDVVGTGADGEPVLRVTRTHRLR